MSDRLDPDLSQCPTNLLGHDLDLLGHDLGANWKGYQQQGSLGNKKKQFHVSMIFCDQQCNFHDLFNARLPASPFSGIFTMQSINA